MITPKENHMHTALLVIGDDPIGQLIQKAPSHWTRTDSTATAAHNSADEDDYWTGDDWYGIGGRYSGTLIPRPGATSGRVYGDTMPGIEAALAGRLSNAGVVAQRMSHHGEGVDQIQLSDLDIVATVDRVAPTAIVVGGVVHRCEITMDEQKLAEWDAMVRRLLTEADPTEMVSVVDAHS
jgi:hypothetical protein